MKKSLSILACIILLLLTIKHSIAETRYKVYNFPELEISIKIPDNYEVTTKTNRNFLFEGFWSKYLVYINFDLLFSDRKMNLDNEDDVRELYGKLENGSGSFNDLQGLLVAAGWYKEQVKDRLSIFTIVYAHEKTDSMSQENELRYINMMKEYGIQIDANYRKVIGQYDCVVLIIENMLQYTLHLRDNHISVMFEMSRDIDDDIIKECDEIVKSIVPLYNPLLN